LYQKIFPGDKLIGEITQYGLSQILNLQSNKIHLTFINIINSIRTKLTFIEKKIKILPLFFDNYIFKSALWKFKKSWEKKQDAPKKRYHSVLIYVGNEQKQQICLISHLRFQHQIKSLEEVTIVSYVDKLVKIYEIVSEKKLFLFWQLSWIQ
jgi:hypothetical protein